MVLTNSFATFENLNSLKDHRHWAYRLYFVGIVHDDHHAIWAAA